MNMYPKWPNTEPNNKHFVPTYGELQTTKQATSIPSTHTTPNIKVDKGTSKQPESQYPSDLYPW